MNQCFIIITVRIKDQDGFTDCTFRNQHYASQGDFSESFFFRVDKFLYIPQSLFSDLRRDLILHSGFNNFRREH